MNPSWRTAGRILVLGSGLRLLSNLIWSGTVHPDILWAGQPKLIVVDQQGRGDFYSLAECLKALPAEATDLTILLKPGVYTEKILIRQNGLHLRGTHRDSTIIQFNQPRTAWDAHPDSIGAAVVNIRSDDVTLEDLTIINTQPEIGPHAFAVLCYGTRLIARNCTFLSKGADTVAPWNSESGMYYFANCRFEGAVDLMCPRGWCFIRDSQFYEVKSTAAIWHAGGFDHRQKFVIVDSQFDGVPGFQLGRHHYDAQFFLINCRFSETMCDQPIFRKTYADSTQNKPYHWGVRNYFYNCHRRGGDFGWFSDNLQTVPDAPAPAEITPAWTFEQIWNPEKK